MTTRTIAAALGLAALALTSGTALAQQAAPSAPPPAPAAPAETSTQPAHPHQAAPRHTAPHGRTATRGATSTDRMADDLNAQSLSAAQSGKDFTPSATPAPAPAKKM